MLGCMEGRTTEVVLSVLIPAYNEAAIIERCLERVRESPRRRLRRARAGSSVVVNDGSSDGTGAIIDAFAARDPRVHVLHHGANLGLGAALKTGFEVCRGEVIVTLDADLTYSVEHIDRLVDAYLTTQAKIVIASPYMSGGEVTAVPRSRLLTSRVANRLLAAASNARLSTYTGMVRAYDARFVRGLTIRANGMEVNAEILRQAQILRARIVEIPAHLDWGASTRVAGPARFRFSGTTLSVAISTFLFRPVMFFMIPGLRAAGPGLHRLRAGRRAGLRRSAADRRARLAGRLGRHPTARLRRARAAAQTQLRRPVRSRVRHLPSVSRGNSSMTTTAAPAKLVLPSDQDASGRTLGREEQEALARVIASGTLNSTKGTEVAALEKSLARLLGVKHVVACSSGSAAVHCAVAALNPEPGDEIVTTAITDMGALHPIIAQGAIPVFADVDPRTCNITAAAVRAVLSERTRAIVVTHLFGNPAEAEAIQALADERGIPVIEDCAQAYLATVERQAGRHLRAPVVLQLAAGQAHHDRRGRLRRDRRRRAGAARVPVRQQGLGLRRRPARPLLPRAELPHDRAAGRGRQRAAAEAAGLGRCAHRHRRRAHRAARPASPGSRRRSSRPMR